MQEQSLITDLIEGCLNGERRSQQMVFKMFAGKMKVVCLRYLKSREDAEDVLQEGFIKVFNNLENYKGQGSFEGWLRRTFVNLSIDFLRKQKRQGWNTSEGIENIEDDHGNEDQEELEVPDFSPEQIMEAMNLLSPVYRTVFNLIAFEQFSHLEVANQLGISIGTSKSNYAKAKKNIQRFLIETKKNNE